MARIARKQRQPADGLVHGSLRLPWRTQRRRARRDLTAGTEPASTYRTGKGWLD